MTPSTAYLRGLIGRANNSSSVSLVCETASAGWELLITASRDATAAPEPGFGMDRFGTEPVLKAPRDKD